MKTPLVIACAALIAACLTPFMSASEAEASSLAGAWRYALDREGVGENERWFARDLRGRLTLPGTLVGQGIGDAVTIDTAWTGDILDRSYFSADEYARYRRPGRIKVPFFLQPEKHYVGAAWYQRTIAIPAEWSDRRVVLTLERPHGRTTVWLDETPIGANDSLSTPHVYELSPILATGPHRLTIRMDNSVVIGVGVNAHSVSDHTQGNWNGLVGRIEIAAASRVWADDVRVFSDVRAKTVRVRGVLRNSTGQLAQGKISVAVEAGSVESPGGLLPVSMNFNTPAERSDFELVLELGPQAREWDEFSAATYTLRVNIAGEIAGRGFAHDERIPFGLREISANGAQLLINGRPLFLRGALDCAIFPATGHPPVDRAAWDKVMRTLKAHGLNHLRFHSWCPPGAAFAAADAAGIYLQVESAMWPNGQVVLGPGSPVGIGSGDTVDAWAYAETERILQAYGNHPSFVMMAVGNEPGGPRHVEFLTEWLNTFRAKDPRRLYTGAAGWPEIPANEFHVTSDPRIQHWNEGLKSRINALPPETRTDYREFINARDRPVVSHEIGQWCVFPNLVEISKYTGYLKARNFEIFRDTLTANHPAAQAPTFLHASGKLQALCYKEDIESALRTPHMGGFQLLGLQDFSGQGSALVGVVDAFWDSKGYITPEQYRRFCNSTVPLARLAKRVFTQDESLAATLELAHYGAAPVHGRVDWKLVDAAGRATATGAWEAREFAVGLQSIGAISIDLAEVAAPARYQLVVEVAGTEFANDWDVWVYPRPNRGATPSPTDVVLTADVDLALTRAGAGDVVWLHMPSDRVKPDAAHGKIELGFSSIFWNTAWTNGQAPHTLGILCDPGHPAFAQFPTEGHSNWQWWFPVTHAAPMILDGLPRNLRPTVQVIDDWFTSRRLALVFEARLGRGKILVTSIDLAEGELDPVRRQLRTSLLAYVGGPQFAPRGRISAEQLRGLFTP